MRGFNGQCKVGAILLYVIFSIFAAAGSLFAAIRFGSAQEVMVPLVIAMLGGATVWWASFGNLRYLEDLAAGK